MKLILYEYQGNMHIHSHYSDGELPIYQIAAIAAGTNLDFIIITDHHTLNGLYKGQEGYRHGVLTLVGMEINHKNNHYLALDVKEVVPADDHCPQNVIDKVNQQQGIGIIAHPIEKGSKLYKNGLTYEWIDWTVDNFQGIEIWNYLSQWRDGITNIWRGIYLLINPQAGMVGPYPEIICKWDEYLLNGKRILAFGGSDAHGTQIKYGPFKITMGSYRTGFQFINMHILSTQPLTGEVNDDKNIVYQALRQGNSWVANDYLMNSKGFRLEVKKNEQVWSSGSQLAYENNLGLHIVTPHTAVVKVFKDGRLWREYRGTNHEFPDVGPGIYRAQAYFSRYRRLHPWIFSNPIWINNNRHR
ncbi:MAG: PHP domain-containing protein [Syntrophomonadaceae bacterium]|nr:PHP domain-containing protein [Syntrophomonadaceae bacterium]